jgi:hypothetical protein
MGTFLIVIVRAQGLLSCAVTVLKSWNNSINSNPTGVLASCVLSATSHRKTDVFISDLSALYYGLLSFNNFFNRTFVLGICPIEELQDLRIIGSACESIL